MPIWIVPDGGLISIHTLRVEGDGTAADGFRHGKTFLSTPSVWRVTGTYPAFIHQNFTISIHTLRVEGDP